MEIQPLLLEHFSLYLKLRECLLTDVVEVVVFAAGADALLGVDGALPFRHVAIKGLKFSFDCLDSKQLCNQHKGVLIQERLLNEDTLSQDKLINEDNLIRDN